MAVEGIIGLAKRAGKLVSGRFSAIKELGRGTAKLLIIATDAAVGTRKELERAAGLKNVPVITHGSKEELGRFIGGPPCSAVVLTDTHMAQGILRTFERGEVNRIEHKSWR